MRKEKNLFWKLPKPSKNKKKKNLVFIPKLTYKSGFGINATDKQITNKQSIKYNNPPKMFIPIKMKPMFSQKLRRKYGDKDFDGSPNFWDCSPKNPAKDGLLSRLLNVVTFGKSGQSRGEYAKEKKEKNIENIKSKIGSGLGKREAGRKIKNINKEYQEGVIARKIQLMEQGPSGEVKILKEKMREGPLSAKEARRFVNLSKRANKEKEARFKKTVGGILETFTPLKNVPEISKYKKTGIKESKKAKGGKVKKGRGRPKEASGKYMIDGVPVYEDDFQKVRLMENEKRKALGLEKIPTYAKSFNTVKGTPVQSQSQSQPQYRSQPSQQYRQIQQTQQVQPTAEDYSEEEYYPEEYPQEYTEQPQQYPTQYPQQPQQPRQQPRQLTVYEAQMLEQQNDNILRAPNFQKGELQNTGGSIFSNKYPTILDAPNSFKGELRHVGTNGEVPAVRLSERPNPNPYGDEYTEIEPGSGRVIVKRRPKEKWATGEAI